MHFLRAPGVHQEQAQGARQTEASRAALAWWKQNPAYLSPFQASAGSARIIGHTVSAALISSFARMMY